MTTIAYKDGVVAYDSRQTQGTRIADDDREKLQIINGVKFVLTGAISDFPTLIDCYFGIHKSGSIDAGGIVVDGGSVWVIGHCDESGFWKESHSRSVPFATGSGAAHAITAMDMGADAETAIAMAAKRDVCTGGRIRSFKL